MSQETLVVQLAPAHAETLKRKLDPARFEFRSAPHAFFSVRGDGVVVTFYNSGKLVIQGSGARLFVEQYVQDLGAGKVAGGKSSAPTPAIETPDAPLIGSDECGKGDYFGPLVVCAVRLEPAQTRELENGLVRDSKTLSDAACLKLGAALRSRCAHAIARLDPPQYNETWGRLRNVNEVLADLHESAIRKLARPGDHVLVDKFADESLLRRRLTGLEIELAQRVRAESVLAVAAASIIAREEFLTALAELSDENAVDLHKGAGEPVDVAARRFVALHGREKLGNVAKLHFKNTQKLGGSGR